jgi:hypothetical protein
MTLDAIAIIDVAGLARKPPGASRKFSNTRLETGCRRRGGVRRPEPEKVAFRG